MRKHDVRKWLHAVLDLLPVILIPVFMVYSHRHDVTENVEVTYKYQSNEVNSIDDLVVGNIYQLNTENAEVSQILNNNDNNILYFELLTPLSFETSMIIDETQNPHYLNENSYVCFNWIHYVSLCEFSNNYQSYFVDYDVEEIVMLNNCIIKLLEINYSINTSYLSYTDYNVIESVDITNSNVMDSFMNKFNTTIDKYFNMGNVFNLNGVYQWFNTNIFSGHAPVVIHSIWNIALYELVMDLLFLLYGLFMWFIDMIQKLMDKPLNSVR